MNKEVELWSDFGSSLLSSNGRFQATLKSDGNFVLMAGGETILWESDTAVSCENTQLDECKFRLQLQNDGDMVILDKKDNLLWSTKTRGQGGEYLILEDTGSLVLYDTSGKSVWATNTSQSGVKLFNI